MAPVKYDFGADTQDEPILFQDFLLSNVFPTHCKATGNRQLG